MPMKPMSTKYPLADCVIDHVVANHPAKISRRNYSAQSRAVLNSSLQKLADDFAIPEQGLIEVINRVWRENPNNYAGPHEIIRYGSPAILIPVLRRMIRNDRGEVRTGEQGEFDLNGF